MEKLKIRVSEIESFGISQVDTICNGEEYYYLLTIVFIHNEDNYVTKPFKDEESVLKAFNDLANCTDTFFDLY